MADCQKQQVGTRNGRIDLSVGFSPSKYKGDKKFRLEAQYNWILWATLIPPRMSIKFGEKVEIKAKLIEF